MSLLADVFLIAGAAGAAFYCFVLSRRLTRFTDLEKGMGGAVAVLSVQVDDMTKALEQARATSADSAETLQDMTHRAEAAATRLELLMASLHDVEDSAPDPTGAIRAQRAVRRSRRTGTEG